jgi:SAM-dependent methyltransferase
VKAITDLRRSPEAETLLDTDAYDAAHTVTEASARALVGVYEGLLAEEYGSAQTFADVLEIGSGSGNLTYGLALSDRFGHVHCSDVSLRFMEILQARMDGFGVEERLSYYLFDANELPFPDGRFDLVVGHSVLHHFARFEDTLAEACRILKPGGCAIFGEPVLDMHVFVSLAARLMLETDDKRGDAESGRRSRFRPQPAQRVFDDQERLVLNAIASEAGFRTRNLRGDRDDLGNVEDKFLVSVKYMETVGVRAGFARMTFSNANNAPSDIGEVVYRRLTTDFGIDAQHLDEYRYIFDALQDVYGDAMRDSLTPLFGYYVLVK